MIDSLGDACVALIANNYLVNVLFFSITKGISPVLACACALPFVTNINVIIIVVGIMRKENKGLNQERGEEREKRVLSSLMI